MAFGDINYLSNNNNDCEIEDSAGNKQRAGLSVDQNLASSLVSTKNGIIAETFASDNIFKGKGFQVHRIFTVPGSGTLKIVLDLTAYTTGIVFTLPLLMRTNEGQCYVNTYKITTYAGGTAITPVNRNSTSANTAQGVFKYGVTSSNTAGNDLRQYIIGALTSPLFTGGGSGNSGNPKIFADDIIMIEIVNKETSAVDFELNVNWYED